MQGLISNAIVFSHQAGWDHGGPWGGEWWWVGRLIMIAIWIILIALAVRWFRGNARRHERMGIERARDILAERFARGEITADEYHERLGHIQ